MAETENVEEKRKTPVVCAKCGRSNRSGTNQCVQCGARLYISCHHCGHSIARVVARCANCGHRLHHSLWSRVRRHVFGRNPKITPFQIALLIAFVIAAYKVITYIVEYQPPSRLGE